MLDEELAKKNSYKTSKTYQRVSKISELLKSSQRSVAARLQKLISTLQFCHSGYTCLIIILK